MYYYVVTVVYLNTNRTSTFKIDEHELYTFIELVTEHVKNLSSFNVTRHHVHKEVS